MNRIHICAAMFRSLVILACIRHVLGQESDLSCWLQSHQQETTGGRTDRPGTALDLLGSKATSTQARIKELRARMQEEEEKIRAEKEKFKAIRAELNKIRNSACPSGGFSERRGELACAILTVVNPFLAVTPQAENRNAVDSSNDPCDAVAIRSGSAVPVEDDTSTSSAICDLSLYQNINFEVVFDTPAVRNVATLNVTYEGNPTQLAAFFFTPAQASMNHIFVQGENIIDISSPALHVVEPGTFSLWRYSGVSADVMQKFPESSSSIDVDWQVYAHYSGHQSYTKALLLLDKSGGSDCEWRAKDPNSRWSTGAAEMPSASQDPSATGLELNTKNNRTRVSFVMNKQGGTCAMFASLVAMAFPQDMEGSGGGLSLLQTCEDAQMVHAFDLCSKHLGADIQKADGPDGDFFNDCVFDVCRGGEVAAELAAELIAVTSVTSEHARMNELRARMREEAEKMKAMRAELKKIRNSVCPSGGDYLTFAEATSTSYKMSNGDEGILDPRLVVTTTFLPAFPDYDCQEVQVIDGSLVFFEDASGTQPCNYSQVQNQFVELIFTTPPLLNISTVNVTFNGDTSQIQYSVQRDPLPEIPGPTPFVQGTNILDISSVLSDLNTIKFSASTGTLQFKVNGYTLCGSQAIVVGDPHIKTLDGRHYTLMKQGTFSLWRYSAVSAEFPASSTRAAEMPSASEQDPSTTGLELNTKNNRTRVSFVMNKQGVRKEVATLSVARTGAPVSTLQTSDSDEKDLGGSDSAALYLQDMEGSGGGLSLLQTCEDAQMVNAFDLCSKHLGADMQQADGPDGDFFDDCVFDVCRGGEVAAELAAELIAVRRSA
eukprot:s3942_g4.t1